ncbi:MAG: hypothetical protein J5845_07665 [Lachnospiraceae bacterium]|nr:hypothetical protein [Lachnospiraceae bacterium]
MAENYIGLDNIGHCLFGDAYSRMRREHDRYRSGYYERGDTFLRYLRNQTGMTVYQNRSLEIVEDHLYYLPLNQCLRSDIYEYSFEREFADITEYCNAHFDFLFLNTASQGNLSTKTILSASDLVVVCLPAAEWVLDILLERYSSLLPKALLVFCGDPDSGFLRRMKKKHSRYRDKMFYIPLTDELKEAVRIGRISDFFHAEQESGNENSRKLLQQIGYLAFSVMRTKKNEEKLRYEDMRTLFLTRNTDPFEKQYSLPAAQACVAERETVHL